ncbi:Flp pilus assembly protein CpaB [Nitratireductor indicus]|uniref:Flp pilus assembly protein CpaB n=1 Tax=Nitratireductor indicus C115 TaxID=1231190 RepID=K2P2J8_9HYPH|nr:Flp pilus assembly protein CpaB [Nitratireductor indicus]EKF44334.1 Flp pilus assembly protein CpaB [Nitratireductor indicus C115]MDS1137287.1 Flp pilus assembly protein CpaB [Nitratireductor indicus]SFQ27643.1 pilus assembly protein CpaB [Nitratireductor indicus]
MSKSRIVILGVAVMAALGAGYVAKNLTAPKPQPVADTGPQKPEVRMTDVLVLGQDVTMGSELNGSLRWEPWPADNVNANFITRDQSPQALEELNSSIARVALYSGEPLRRSKLIGEGISFMSAILPSGKRAVATQIAADTSAGGFILPNDFVDVIMTRRQQEAVSTGGFITETILKNIKVLAIDQTIQEDEEGRRVKVGETATLELTPEQAEIITVAQQMADRLTLSLRAITDTNEPVTNEGSYLVSGAGRGNSIRLIKSGQVSEVGTRK